MSRSLLIVATGMISSLATFAQEPVKEVLPVKYSVDVAVYRGDPLGSKKQGTLELLSQTRLEIENEQSGSMGVGHLIEGFNLTPAGSGILVELKPVKQNDTAKMEIECTFGKSVSKWENELVLQTSVVRQTIEAKEGETNRFRIKMISATNQYWVEYSVSEIPPEVLAKRLEAEKTRKESLERMFKQIQEAQQKKK